jgi:hypothetical protein
MAIGWSAFDCAIAPDQLGLDVPCRLAIGVGRAVIVIEREARVAARIDPDRSPAAALRRCSGSPRPSARSSRRGRTAECGRSAPPPRSSGRRCSACWSSNRTSRRRPADRPARLVRPCSVTGATRNAGPNIYSSPRVAPWDRREVHEQRPHERRAGLVGLSPERIEVRDQRVAQPQIAREHRLRRRAIFPDRGGRALAVDAQSRGEGVVLEPADEQLGIVGIIRRHRRRTRRDRPAPVVRPWVPDGHCQPPVSLLQ